MLSTLRWAGSAANANSLADPNASFDSTLPCASGTGMFFLSSAYMTFRPLSASKGACRLPLRAPQHFGNQFITDDERINFLRSSSRGHVRLQDSIASRGYTTRCVFITTLCNIRRTCICMCICTCIILYHDVYVT